jgi:hypothetical protein
MAPNNANLAHLTYVDYPTRPSFNVQHHTSPPTSLTALNAKHREQSSSLEPGEIDEREEAHKRFENLDRLFKTMTDDLDTLEALVMYRPNKNGPNSNDRVSDGLLQKLSTEGTNSGVKAEAKTNKSI